MKRMKIWAAGAMVGVMLAAVGLAGCSQKETLNLYSWADNFDAQVLKDFEDKYNVKVNYAIFANNEELLAKIQAGGTDYDVIQPSDYMVGTMIKQGLLEPLNKDNIPNWANISDQFKNLPYDPGNQYSLVYTWGVTGIAYNKKYVKENIESWNDLWNPKYAGKVLLLDDNREVLGIGLKKQGISNSTTDEKQIRSAADDLKKLVPNVLAFDTDNIKQKMIAEDGWIGSVWSGDAAFIQAENPDIEFVVPKEGGTIWADNYAIPKGAKHKDLAEKFINYMFEPEVSAKNYESIGYGDPNEKAKPLHSAEYQANKTIYLSDDEMKRTEWLLDVGTALQTYDRVWTELKSGGQ